MPVGAGRSGSVIRGRIGVGAGGSSHRPLKVPSMRYAQLFLLRFARPLLVLR